ncbi:MAG: serine protease [Porticoccaceae bacterium]|nr:MAG: serine protease [Porticoccaceae bacterium]
MRKFALLWLALGLSVALPVMALEAPGSADLRATGKAFAAVGRAVSPAVVLVRVEGKAAAPASPFGPFPFDDEFLRRFFGEEFPGLRPPQSAPRGRAIIGQGSGFAFRSERGLTGGKTYILTNNHVVEKGERIRVQFLDGREFDAEVTGRDPQSDVAVLEVAESGLPTARLGDSEKLEVGEWVVAIGNPFGLSHTLTVGVVSAKGRTSVGINDYEDFIQTDAAINPGNSGGPLVNLDGEVVGINTAIFTRSGGYMGIGFAIPINLARAVADQLIEHGEVVRGYLGVVIQPLTAELAEAFGLEPQSGVLIAEVAEDSPAAKAGIRAGDVVVSYQGQPVRDVGDFRNRVALTRPGTKASLEILRDGKRQRLEVTIGKLTPDRVAGARGDDGESAKLGIVVDEITPELAQRLGVEPGEGGSGDRGGTRFHRRLGGHRSGDRDPRSGSRQGRLGDRLPKGHRQGRAKAPGGAARAPAGRAALRGLELVSERPH